MKRHVATLPDGTPVRLSEGTHSSPGEGVCVVELASVIAGEEFSDRPLCVCPVIGAFLRGWNDRASHAERQRLAPFAGRIVGSRAEPRVTRERRDMCLEWARAGPGRGTSPSSSSELAIRLRMAILCGLEAALRPEEGAGELAARAAFARGDAEGAFEFLEALLSAGEDRVPEARWAADASNGHSRTNGHARTSGHVGTNGHARTNGHMGTNGHAQTNGHARTNGHAQVPADLSDNGQTDRQMEGRQTRPEPPSEPATPARPSP